MPRSVSEIDAAIAQLQAERVEAQKAEKAEAKAGIQKILDDTGLTLDELFPKGASGKPQAGTKRYRHKATGQEFTNRGRKPSWVIEALAKGETLDEHFELAD